MTSNSGVCVTCDNTSLCAVCGAVHPVRPVPLDVTHNTQTVPPKNPRTTQPGGSQRRGREKRTTDGDGCGAVPCGVAASGGVWWPNTPRGTDLQHGVGGGVAGQAPAHHNHRCSGHWRRGNGSGKESTQPCQSNFLHGPRLKKVAWIWCVWVCVGEGKDKRLRQK